MNSLNCPCLSETFIHAGMTVYFITRTWSRFMKAFYYVITVIAWDDSSLFTTHGSMSHFSLTNKLMQQYQTSLSKDVLLAKQFIQVKCQCLKLFCNDGPKLYLCLYHCVWTSHIHWTLNFCGRILQDTCFLKYFALTGRKYELLDVLMSLCLDLL